MKTHLFSATAILVTLASSGVVSACPPSSSTTPRQLDVAPGGYSSVEMDPALGPALDSHMQGIVAPGSLTRGAVLEVARYGKIVYSNRIGYLHGNPSLLAPGSTLSASTPMTNDAIFDLESMTKIVTAALIVRLSELGYIGLNDKVSKYIPEISYSHIYNATYDGWVDADADGEPDVVFDAAKDSITVLDLMTYRAGLPIDATSFDPVLGSPDPWATMAHVPLDYAPGTTQLYSDLSYRLLGHVAEVAMLAPLHELVRQLITGPFEMTDSDYEPRFYMSGSTVSYSTGAGRHHVHTVKKLERVAGTGPSSALARAYAWAEVQDDNDHWTQRHNVIHTDKNGNIVNLAIGTPMAPSGTGCDGLFSTVRDFMKLGQIFLNMGKKVSPAPNGIVCIQAPCTMITQLLSPVDVASMTDVPAPTATFQPLIPSSTYPVAKSFGQNLIHSHKGWGWELPDGGAFSPAGQIATWDAVIKTGGAGTYVKLDYASDTIAVLMTNHGLPDFGGFAAQPINEPPYYMVTWQGFDDMLAETGPAAVNDLVASSIVCPSSI